MQTVRALITQIEDERLKVRDCKIYLNTDTTILAELRRNWEATATRTPAKAARR